GEGVGADPDQGVDVAGSEGRVRQRPAHQRRQPGPYLLGVPVARVPDGLPGRTVVRWHQVPPRHPGLGDEPQDEAEPRMVAVPGGVPGEGLLAGDHLLGYGDCGLAQYRHGFTTTSFARRADRSGNGHIESDRWPGMALPVRYAV